MPIFVTEKAFLPQKNGRKMRKIVMAVMMAAMVTMAARAQQISGTWNGQLDLQVMKLNLVFHFDGGCTVFGRLERRKNRRNIQPNGA